MSEPTRLKSIATGAFISAPLSVAIGAACAWFLVWPLADAFPSLTQDLGQNFSRVLFLISTGVAVLLSSGLTKSGRSFYPLTVATAAGAITATGIAYKLPTF